MAEESKLAEKLENSTKFSAEEMKTVKDIQQKYVDVQHKFGQLSIAELRLEQQVNTLESTKEGLHQNFLDVQNEEKEFINVITEKYGDGILNPETGTYSPKSEK